MERESEEARENKERRKRKRVGKKLNNQEELKEEEPTRNQRRDELWSVGRNEGGNEEDEEEEAGRRRKERHQEELKEVLLAFGRTEEKDVALEIIDIKLLSTMFSEVNGNAELRVSLEHVDDELVQFITGLMKKHKGKHRIKFKVTYADQGIELGLLPKKLKVDFNKDFVEEIHQKPQLRLHLN